MGLGSAAPEIRSGVFDERDDRKDHNHTDGQRTDNGNGLQIVQRIFRKQQPHRQHNQEDSPEYAEPAVRQLIRLETALAECTGNQRGGVQRSAQQQRHHQGHHQHDQLGKRQGFQDRHCHRLGGLTGHDRSGQRHSIDKLQTHAVVTEDHESDPASGDTPGIAFHDDLAERPAAADLRNEERRAHGPAEPVGPVEDGPVLREQRLAQRIKLGGEPQEVGGQVAEGSHKGLQHEDGPAGEQKYKGEQSQEQPDAELAEPGDGFHAYTGRNCIDHTQHHDNGNIGASACIESEQPAQNRPDDGRGDGE